jgi:hypothetical protein
MRGRAFVEVAVHPGGMESPRVVRVPLSEDIAREVFEPLELSDDPFALLLNSYPLGRDYAVVRRKKLEYRGYIAKEVAEAVNRALKEAFGAQDTTDGYSPDQR